MTAPETTAPETTTLPPAIDWGSMTPVVVDTVTARQAKTVDDIDQQIRSWADQSFDQKKALQVVTPSPIAAKVLRRDLKDYCLMVRPRRTATVSIKKDEVTVTFLISAYDEAGAAASKAAADKALAAKAAAAKAAAAKGK